MAAFWIFSSGITAFCSFSSGWRCSLSSLPDDDGAGRRITLSAILSASCSNLSPGLFTSIFICTDGSAADRVGAKKLSREARAMNGWCAVRDAVVEADDLSTLVRMIPALERDDVSSNRHHALPPCL